MDGPRHRSSAFTYVAERSLGLANDFCESLYREEVAGLRAASRNYIYDGGMRVWCMELDPVDARFLLVGTSKSTLRLYDLAELDARDAVPRDGRGDRIGGTGEARDYDTSHRLPPSASTVAAPIPGSTRPGVSSSRAPIASPPPRGITSVDWYPVDGGIFISSSMDGVVRVWDANAWTVESAFELGCRVHVAKFSPIAATHALLAAATSEREVRLCDLQTETAVHSLLGHVDEVWSLAWSPENEFQLATGSRAGEIRLWDIRRSGATACLLCLNQMGLADIPGRSTLHSHIRRREQPPTLSTASTSRPTRTNRPSKKRRLQEGRSDPNLAASTSLARAHAAGVNGLAYTPDGRFLLSSGHDHKLRLWNTKTGEHLFNNYESTRSTQVARNIQLAVVQEGDAQTGTFVFHPNGDQGELTSYLVHGDRGRPLSAFTAHFRAVTCCVYRKTHRQLLSGATDGLIMKWSPTPLNLDQGGDADGDQNGADNDADDQDAWSDEDEGGASGGGFHNDAFVPPILRDL